MYQRIRDLREDHDFTQKFIAEKLSFSNTNYFANLEQVIHFLITQEIWQSDIDGIKNLDKFIKEFKQTRQI